MDPELVRLLVIEDDPAFAKLVATTLAVSKSARFQTERTTDLASGLALLKDRSFDLVLLDLDLPDCKGVDTLRRAIAAAPHIPIVVMTGHDDEQTALLAMKHGAEDYLMKGPVDEEALVRAVRYALRRHRNVVDLRQFAQELMTNIDRFMSIVERARIGAVVTSPEGLVLYHNDAALRLLGRSAADLRTTTFALPGAPGEALHLDAGTLGPVEEGSACVEVQLAATEWDDRPARLHLVYPCMHGAGDTPNDTAPPSSWGGEDVSTLLSDHAMETVLVVDTDGTVRAASPSAGRIFGDGDARLVGTSLWELLPRGDGAFREAFLSALEHGEETVVRHPLGHGGIEAVTALRPRMDPVIGIAKGMVCVVHPDPEPATRTRPEDPSRPFLQRAEAMRASLDNLAAQVHALGSGEIGALDPVQRKCLALIEAELLMLDGLMAGIRQEREHPSDRPRGDPKGR